MSYFLSGRPLAEGMTLPLEGEEADHLLKSRRMRPGEHFPLQDPSGRRFDAELVDVERRRATVRVGGVLPVPGMPPLEVTLLQGAVKDKAAEWIVQKATELGVARVVFFSAGYSTVSLDALNAPKTRARWERIAWEACKQSGRQFPPLLSVAGDLEAVLSAHPLGGAGATGTHTPGWLLTPEGAPPPAPGNGGGNGGPRRKGSLFILVGPEGGFEPGEVEAGLAVGFHPVAMGAHTLRAETAALAACSLALFI